MNLATVEHDDQPAWKIRDAFHQSKLTFDEVSTNYAHSLQQCHCGKTNERGVNG